MGKKSKELLRRLRGGLPADEAVVLLREVQEERARERAPKTNPHRYEDERAQRLSDLWFSQRETATVEQKDKVGLAFISHALGLGDGIAKRFAESDTGVYHEVGMQQAHGCQGSNTNLLGFWERVREIFPGAYSDGDITYLSQKSGVEVAFHLLWQLEIPLAEESPILRSLARNTHAYK